jgi:signal transduction histidine kinase/phage shock protein PspC (stress-responsive transcriptional regulator)
MRGHPGRTLRWPEVIRVPPGTRTGAGVPPSTWHERPTTSREEDAITGQQAPTSTHASPAVLVRSRDHKVIAGVAHGLGARLGVDPVFVRAAFVTFAAAGGAGIVIYAFLWLLSTPAEAGDEPDPRPSDDQRALAFGCIALGLLVLLHAASIWFGDTLVWSVGLASVGSAVIWSRTDERGRARWTDAAARIPGDPFEAVFTGRISPLRILGGGVLVLGGMGAFLAGSASLASFGTVLVAMTVTVTGAALILGPWMWRLARQLADERRERIRSEERAEVAAHLHDSVLQTLALIQRSDSPREMAALARGQERELRSWLYGRGPGATDTLGGAVTATAERIEALHHVPVEVVLVGDAPLDERAQALVHAIGEAITNAAKHSGAPKVSVYVEVEPECLTAYVTDEGKGFDVDRLPPGRHGITASIQGRMGRHGGTATISSELGEGTEIGLELPRVRP